MLRCAARAMATRFELVLEGDDDARLRALGEAALDEIRDCEARLSAFAPGSLLRRVNACAHERCVALDGDTFALLTLCREVWRASRGAFDPSVGPLLRAWGLRGTPRASGAEIAAARIGFEHVELDAQARAVRWRRQGIELDLGAIGKGWALDRAGEVLRAHGVRCALLHGGTSSVLALGAPPGRDAWTVQVEGRAVALRDQALGVSAAHGRVAAGVGHVLDPRTRAPARALGPVAVRAPSAALADAWSTALLVAGEDLTLPEGIFAV